MDVYEAVKSRRAVRGFTNEPVSRAVLERVLSAAAWSRPDRTFSRGRSTC